MAVSLSIRLPETTAKALEDVASATKRSKALVLREALETYLAEYADYKAASDRLMDKGNTVISAADLRKRLR
jgi:predicted DNA-binding protein